ncbi:hypothetical protein ACFSCX_21485 [Bacillus salitolerans]|uniref:Uncharacterized protein n=1 Tax=Bacillus salitolerans TaxID=1437434 RepID=A0ABW4LVX9_9BACI
MKMKSRETNNTIMRITRWIMWICPLCNGFEAVASTCPICNQVMEDKGRIIDYFDDYSAYMEIDDMKKIDGYENSLSQHECAHLLYCENCSIDQVVFIKE